MGVITPTFTKNRGPTGGIDAVIIKWSSIGDSDTCTPVQRPDLADRSFQVEGTFGGATMALQGSNDSTTGSDGHFETLTNPVGTAATQSSAGVMQITEATRWIMPKTSGGSGSSLTVTVCARRSMRGG
jgi:hypothetical protein